MFAIPNFLIFHPFQKAYVKQHMRNGKEIGPYFTKRPPAKVKEKHLTERFIDHSEASARKTHADLEKEKRQHQSILEALKQHHDELVSKGDNADDDGKGLSHKEKIAHLKAEIKNQETHLANKTRKQDLIKNRYEINKKQVAKKQEDSLNKKLSQYSEGQQKTIKDIHKANSEGKSKLVPGRILKGKDKDHIYLEAKHKDTGEPHHIAIHQDGSLKDPQILHGGKFDSKALSEPESPKEPKKVKVKEEIKEKKKAPKKGKEIPKPNIPEVISKRKKDKSVGNTDQAKVEDWRENGINSKAFKNWFGDSKVVDKNGKPLVVYHGTRGDIKEFGEKFLGKNTKAESAKKGFFFTSSPKVASGYSSIGPTRREHELRNKLTKMVEESKYDFPISQDKEIKKIYDELSRIEMDGDSEATKETRLMKKEKEKAEDDLWDLFSESKYKNYDEFYNNVNTKEVRSLKEKINRYENRFFNFGSNVAPVYLSLQNPIIKDYKGEEYREVSYNELLKQAKQGGNDGAIFLNTYDPGGKGYDEKTNIYIAFDPNQIKSSFNRGTFDKNSNDLNKSISSKEDIKSDLIKQAKDQVAFTKAIKGGKIEDYEAYINFFPKGKYLGDAHKQLSKLEDLKKSVKEKRSRKNKRKKRK
jgi:hypothetical protein